MNADEILAVLDTDTRSYLKLLINGAGKGLKGRDDDLRQVFRRLGPLHRDLDELNSEVVKRKRNLARADPQLRLHRRAAWAARTDALTALVADAEHGVRPPRPRGHADLRRRWSGCPAR